MDEKIRECMSALIEAILSSGDYRDYKRCEEELSQYPGMLETIMDLRKQTIELYRCSSEDEFIAGTEELGRKYEVIQKYPEVNAFLEAEDAILRMLQDVSTGVSDAVIRLTPEI